MVNRLDIDMMLIVEITAYSDILNDIFAFVQTF